MLSHLTFLLEPANRKLTKELCDVIDDFGLVNFSTLDIQVCISQLRLFQSKFSLHQLLQEVFGLQDKESVGNLVKLIDKSNGYIFSSIDSSAVEFSKIAAAPLDWDYYRYPLLGLLILFSNKSFVTFNLFYYLQWSRTRRTLLNHLTQLLRAQVQNTDHTE